MLRNLTVNNHDGSNVKKKIHNKISLRIIPLKIYHE